MHIRFSHRVLFLFCLSCSLVLVQTHPLFAGKKAETPIIVDFTAGTVGGVTIRGDIADISKTIGPNRIRKTTEELEGEPSDVYIISFGDHKIFKHESNFSYNDPIFRTKEGLGVGSEVQDFDRRYGQGRVSDEEGFAIYYDTETAQVGVATKYIKSKEQHINLYKNSIVENIWVW